jgi:hypothetical protein
MSRDVDARAPAWSAAGMANVLNEERKQRVIMLGRLGWPLRRIEEATGVRREEITDPESPAKTGQGGDHRLGRHGKTGHEVMTDSAVAVTPSPTWPPTARKKSGVECMRAIQRAHRAGAGEGPEGGRPLARPGDRAWLRHEVRERAALVRKLPGSSPPEARDFLVTKPGEEAQFDHGEDPMVRYPETGKYRRTRLFVFSIGFSRKSVRLLLFKSSSKAWAQLPRDRLSSTGRGG